MLLCMLTVQRGISFLIILGGSGAGIGQFRNSPGTSICWEKWFMFNIQKSDVCSPF